MKLSSFFFSVFAAGILFSSCNNSDKTTDQTTTDTTKMDTTNTSTSNTTTNTIVTTPQNMVVVMHKVKDFASWKASYDMHDSARLANGLHSYVVARGAMDTSMVLVALKVDDMDKAKAFAKDPGLKQAMQKGGVIGTPTMTFNTMVWQDTGQISTTVRSRTMVTVKDFETWRTAFEQHRQERADNGIVDRAFGHEVDNDKKVTVVVAITDSAKANAYWKSDTLKKMMSNSGVVGQPQRFIYKVVQRY